MTRLLSLLLLPALASCGTPFQSRQVNYAYVGDLHTGQPRHLDTFTKKHHVTTVPIQFSGGQWQLNSAICFHHASAEVQGNEIHLTVFTALCSDKSPPGTPSFDVKNLTLPEYRVVFIDPDGTRHPLGKLRP